MNGKQCKRNYKIHESIDSDNIYSQYHMQRDLIQSINQSINQSVNFRVAYIAMPLLGPL